MPNKNEIIYNKDTKIMLRNDKEHLIPKFNLNLIKIKDIQGKPVKTMINIIGIVYEVGLIKQIKKTASNSHSNMVRNI